MTLRSTCCIDQHSDDAKIGFAATCSVQVASLLEAAADSDSADYSRALRLLHKEAGCAGKKHTGLHRSASFYPVWSRREISSGSSSTYECRPSPSIVGQIAVRLQLLANTAGFAIEDRGL